MSYVHCLAMHYAVFTDIDECNDTMRCGPNQVCIDTIGSYECNCIEGYTPSQDGDGCEGNGL